MNSGQGGEASTACRKQKMLVSGQRHVEEEEERETQS